MSTLSTAERHPRRDDALQERPRGRHEPVGVSHRERATRRGDSSRSIFAASLTNQTVQ